MSVINRMLRDLDKRQQHQNQQTYTPAAVAPQPIHWGWIVGILLLSLAVIIGALNLWWMYSANSSEPVTTPEQTLATADDVSPPPAQQVIEPVVSKPKSTAIVDVKNLPDSQPERQQEPQSESQSEQQPVSQPELTAINEEQPQSSAKLAVTAAEEPPAPVTPAVRKKTAQEQSVSSFSVERVQLSPQQLADTNLAKAREALQKGEQIRGQELLEKALIVKPDHVQVRSELAAYWYGKGLTSRATTLLHQGLELKPQQAEWQLLLARIYERIGRIEQAYKVLAVISPQAPEHRELLQLRAAAATQLGYFNEAAADYTALAAEVNEGRWWLAAAVAYDDGGNLDAAVRSYRQALQQNDLGQDARLYIEQRLAVLEGF